MTAEEIIAEVDRFFLDVLSLYSRREQMVSVTPFLSDQPLDAETSELPKSGVMGDDPVKAGAAFTKLLVTNPALEAGLKAFRARLKTEMATPEFQERTRKAKAEFDVSDAEQNAELESYGLGGLVNNINTWQELCDVLQIDPNDVTNYWEFGRIARAQHKRERFLEVARLKAREQHATQRQSPPVMESPKPPAAPKGERTPVDGEHDSAVTTEGAKTPEGEGAPSSAMLLTEAELADLAGCVTPQTLSFVRFLRAHSRSVFWNDLPNECWRNGSMPLKDSVKTALERSQTELSKVYQRWGLTLTPLNNERVQLTRRSS